MWEVKLWSTNGEQHKKTQTKEVEYKTIETVSENGLRLGLALGCSTE